ncbi:hypothetical protein N0V88_007983 [Collariella sp. IMI 366227]|nr:hypothetical protein N0V88_007983 [Collariella sp. IMI 366227]
MPNSQLGWTEKETTAIRREIDWHTVPLVTLFYMFCFLDRINIGNARIQGLAKDLNLNVNNRFNWALSIVYIMYLLIEVPSNIILKRICGRCFYKRNELLFRMGIYVSAASIAGVFGGLLATGLFQIPELGAGAGRIHTWKNIIFFKELVTIIIGLIAPLWMPTNHSTAYFLTECERRIAAERLVHSAGRAVTSAYAIFGTIGGIVAMWTYVQSDAPKYHTCHTINLGGQVVVVCQAIFGIFYCMSENKARGAGKRDHRLAGLS